jgi:hypothetical protein
MNYMKQYFKSVKHMVKATYQPRQFISLIAEQGGFTNFKI